MSRQVVCRKYGVALPGLAAPPLPGAVGKDLFENVSAKAWGEWQTLQTMLINEGHLSLRDASARQFLSRVGPTTRIGRFRAFAGPRRPFRTMFTRSPRLSHVGGHGRTPRRPGCAGCNGRRRRSRGSDSDQLESARAWSRLASSTSRSTPRPCSYIIPRVIIAPARP